jgi:hypothetical protein
MDTNKTKPTKAQLKVLNTVASAYYGKRDAISERCASAGWLTWTGKFTPTYNGKPCSYILPCWELTAEGKAVLAVDKIKRIIKVQDSQNGILCDVWVGLGSAGEDHTMPIITHKYYTRASLETAIENGSAFLTATP